MTDERLAEILKQCHKYDTEEEETIIDLITALRAERTKVADMREAVCLLNSMVYCGEKHNERSEAVVKKAIGTHVLMSEL